MCNRNRFAVSAILAVALLLSLFPSGGYAAPAPQLASGRIKLRAASFNPLQGESPAIPANLSINGYAPEQRGYYIVQFAGPIQQSWLAETSALGAEVLEYLPDFAFKVRMSPAQAAQVAQLENVAWIGLFQPAFKLSPALKRDGTHIYRVRIERGADAGVAAVAIAQSGAEVVKRDRSVLLVSADASRLDAIAQVLDVAWIENFVMNEKHNEYGAGVIMGANQVNASGYDGSTQIAAVADSGLGDGTPGGAHPDIPASRITAIYDWSTDDIRFCYRVRPDGAQDADVGHGTHVALSVVSDGGVNGEGKGVAPAANLVFQAVEEYLDTYGICNNPSMPDGYYLIGLPDDLRDLFQQAYDAGARIHANSWGAAVAGEYTTDSASADDFIWNNPDMTITFSAGNEGTDANGDGVVDDDSIGSPATAKNVITVGASENDRGGNYQCDQNLTYTSHDAYQPNETCGSMGGQNLLGTYGSRWPADYPAEPLASDVTAGDAEQMASFSSRGPTDDGRLKPDVVAPGTWILSGFSPLYQEGYSGALNPQNGAPQYDGWGMPFNAQYKYMGGTSMSNPLAAGAATIVRDYYQKAHSAAASAALVKATLINSAVDLLDENNDGADDNDYPIPNVHEGWGRIDLVAATDDSHQFVDEAQGLTTGETATYGFTVETAGGPFKASLVWSDPASAETAAINLVNDLDLVVTSPSGAVYYGNVFSGGWSQSGGDLDRLNNVENVYIESAEAGDWTVAVTGYNVPSGTQPFALVVDGADGTVEPPDTAPMVDITYPAEGDIVSGNVAAGIYATDAEDASGTLTVEWAVDGGPWQPAVQDVGDSYTASWDTTTVADGPHTLAARATDSANNVTETSINVTVNNSVATTLHVGDLDASATSRARRWNATATIIIHDSFENPVADAQVDGQWNSGGAVSCSTDSNGQCDVLIFGLSRNTDAVSFTVTDVMHPSYTYQPSSNHDPDDDSDGTSITIINPRLGAAGGEGDGTGANDNAIYLPLVNQ